MVTFRIPSHIDLSTRTTLLSAGRRLAVGAALLALENRSGREGRGKASGPDSSPSQASPPILPRLRFALVTHYLTTQFVDSEDASAVLQTLLELRQETEARLYRGYKDNGLPPHAGSDYPGPKLKEGLLYLLVRALRPNLVVETGVDQGLSSCFILEALHQNAKGRLHSIDVGGTTRSGNPVGWLVPTPLRERWTLTLQPAELALPTLQGNPEVFLHDSLHTFEHMMLEFEWARERLCVGGLLVSDDIGFNDAFRLFLVQHRGEFNTISERLVGIARKEGRP